MLRWFKTGPTPSTSHHLPLSLLARRGTFSSRRRKKAGAGSGWRRRIMFHMLGISRRIRSWLMALIRIGVHAPWVVNLDFTLTKYMMPNLVYLQIQQQLLFIDPWNQLDTIWKTILMKHDGGKGYSIIMTTSLSSDVPVGYFSWAEYDIMAPMQPKTAGGLAAAFISNCGALNFRLQALEKLEKLDIKIDSYGGCHRTHDGNVDKVDTLKRYKFSLAFENSNEEDYVTEKFFQSLVAGAIPVVVGAPNIQDFAPYPDSILHIRELDDVPSVAQTMKYLAANPSAYNKTMSWKFEGPSDSFKALVDMAAVHSSCRLCVHIATTIHDKEESSSPSFQKRPCKCNSKRGTLYHLYVRERGRFNMESLFLSSRNLTIGSLEEAVVRKFKSLKHVPIWKRERPNSLSGGDELRIHRIYPIGLTQREALYSFRFQTDSALRSHIQNHPCTKFEVIFV